MEDEAKKEINWSKVLVIVVASLAILAVVTGIGFAVAGTGRSGNCTYGTDAVRQVGAGGGQGCHMSPTGGSDGEGCTGKGQDDCGGAGTGCAGKAGQANGSCHGQAGGTASPGTCPDCTNGAAVPAPAK